MTRRFVVTMLIWVAAAVGWRVTVARPERCPVTNPAAVRASAAASVGWIAAAAKADGSFIYEYDRRLDTESPDYNIVRHAGVVMSLYQAAALEPTLADTALDTADPALAYMTDRTLEHDDWSAFIPAGRDGELGATSLMLAGLAFRRDATNDRSNDILMHRLGRFILTQQRDDGGFWLFWSRAQQRTVIGPTSLYATGEAFFALTLLHNRFPDGGWEAPARRAAEYISTKRDAEEQPRYTPWADQWAAYALNEMAEWPLSETNVTYARRLAERFGLLERGEAQKRSGTISRLLRSHLSRGAGFGTVVEGLGSFWRLTAAEPRLADLHDPLTHRLRCAAGIEVERQITSAEARGTPRPELVVGAWFDGDQTRMDDQQHPTSGLLRSIPALAEGSA